MSVTDYRLLWENVLETDEEIAFPKQYKGLRKVHHGIIPRRVLELY